MRWTVLAGALAAVFACAGAAFVSFHHGSPKLVEGSTSTTPGPSGAIELRYRDGQDATFLLSVRNAGSDPVKLTGASILGAGGMLERRSASFQTQRGTSTGSTITVPPDQEARIIYTGRFVGCKRFAFGSAVASRTVTLRYGDDGSALDVPLRVAVQVTAPRSCPGRR